MEECVACVSKYTNVRRIKTICPLCEFECCKECLSKNIKYNGFHCAGCKKLHDPEFIKSIFSNTFIKKSYITYMKRYVLDSEMKLIPGTKKKILIEKKRKEITKLMEDAIISIGENVRPLFEQKLLNVSSSCFKDCFYPNCKGVMYRDEDEKYFNCEECNNFGCSDCEDVCDNINTHKCDKEKIKLLELIKKDTTSCPNCSERIFKADGCSQIMCSKCKTFFNFNTGLEENKTEPRHAMDFHLLSEKFEISVIGKNRYDNFVSNIKICKDWDLWNKDKEKNNYFNIIHGHRVVQGVCASIINYKVYLRKILISCIDARDFNELNRKKFINKDYSESLFVELSANYYFKAYCRLYIIRKLVNHFFQLQEKLHEYVKTYKNIKRDAKINKKREAVFVNEVKEIENKTGKIINAFGILSVSIDQFKYGSEFVR